MRQTFLSILLMLLPMMASADAVEIGGIWYNLVPKAKEAEVASNPNKYSGDVVIPPSVTYNGQPYSVTSIGDFAFYKCSGLTSVTIPNSVTSIGNQAFYYCSGLTSVTIPNSVTSIGSGAFSGCSGLTSVTIPNSVTYIGDHAFSSCSGLTSVTIPNSVTSIGWYAFQGCSGLTSVTIPNSVTSIGQGAFSYCSGLTSVTVGTSVTDIGYEAFRGCSGLTSVTIPNSVTSIGHGAFWLCTGLTSVTIPNSVTSIGDEAFYGCSGLTSVTIPNSVTTIGEQAFANCDELTDVYCHAEKLRNNWSGEGLYTYPDAFKDSYPQYMTLHVPAASIEAYRSMEPWSQFNAFVSLEDGDTPTIQKCATPEISYANGKLTFTCETDGAEFVTSISDTDIKTHYGSEITLSQKYTVSVYATKAGYENSDVATREIVIENGQSSLFGDLNKDGKVNVADHVKLSKIILNQQENE